jgi:hypothetical protein
MVGECLFTLRFFYFSNIRFPLTSFQMEVLKFYDMHFSHIHPLGFSKVTHFEIACKACKGMVTVTLFRLSYRLKADGDWFTFEKRRKPVPSCTSKIPTCLPSWKDQFFFVDIAFLSEALNFRLTSEGVKDDDIPMTGYDEELYGKLCKHPTPVNKYPEFVLAIAGLSNKWKDQATRPIVKKN